MLKFRNLILLLFLIFFLDACQSSGSVDIDKIKIDIQFERMEDDIFKLNANNYIEQTKLLENKYGKFLNDYYFNIVGLKKDSIQNRLLNFIDIYNPIYQDAAKKMKNLQKEFLIIENGLKRVHYYFPNYTLPKKIVSFIGPMNTFSCVLTQDVLGIGLQMYLGEDDIYYKTEDLQFAYPDYIIRNFNRNNIPINCLTNIFEDIHQKPNNSNTLIQEIVEQGKKAYILKKILPELHDSLIFGYSNIHLKNLIYNEKDVWVYFLKNDLLFSRDPGTIRDFIGIGPYCTAISEQLPANIGYYIGYKIVSKWMSKKKGVENLKELLQKDNLNLFNDSGYKPS